MCVLGEIEFMNILLFKSREAQAGLEGVWLGNFLDRFEKGAAIDEAESLPRAAEAFGFDRDPIAAKPWRKFKIIDVAQPETRRHAVLVHLQKVSFPAGIDAARLVMRMRRVL